MTFGLRGKWRPPVNKTVWLIVLLLLPVVTAETRGASRWSDFDPADYEEDGGSGFTVFSRPGDGVYGFGFGSGLWLKNTPVFGDYLIRLYRHRGERAYYSGIGMTLRLMPRWTVAPYIGGGGNYNYSLSRSGRAADETERAAGGSYWSGHVETGLRIWMPRRLQFIDAAVRRAWNAGPDDYTLVFVGFGTGPPPRR